MKKRLFAIIAVLVCFALLAFSTGVLADFGGFSGDDDFGGSDWGGSDWGDSDYGGGSFWGGTSDDYYDSDGRGGGCGGGTTLIVIIIIIVILVIAFRNKKNTGGNRPPVQTAVHRTDDSALKSIDSYIKDVDEGFSAADMQTKLENLYVQLQDCWSAKDLTPLRPYLTDELYNKSDRQLDEYRRNEQTPHVDRIAVLGSNIRGWFQRDGMDHIIVELSTRITTYTTDKAGNVVRGDKNAEKFMTYEWDLARTTGVKTADAAEMKSVNCPNCGAPVTINKSAKCPYCETVITLDEHDWVLFSIKALSQRTSR